MNRCEAQLRQPAVLPFGSLEWFKRELATTPGTRSQNSDYCRCRGVMRDHFDDAPSAGVVCHRLYGFLRFPGDQA